MKYYEKVLKTFLKKMVLFRQNHSRNILKTLQKYFTKGHKETFQKDFLYHCLKYYEKVSKRFLGKMFLWNGKCKKNIFETLQKYFSKGYKETFQIISVSLPEML